VVPQAEKLKQLIKAQSELLGRGLRVHSAICPAELRGLQEQLESTSRCACALTGLLQW
jgi:hypothetical protein